ncbi:MAG: gliding motility-associated C-terminal domain-containing protein, partial [Bacteroidetes bacterium]|nr:gliding motility-associated C-terminal domain-containing protein [Bacteroidota bacterium]
PNGAIHSASLDPSVDAIGVYTYTIAAVAPCAGDAAQVTVTINNPPNAGADGALTLCAQGASANLFAQLTGATAGGTWSAPNGSGHSAFFDPASDTIGTYTYTLSGTAPCPADHATVNVELTTTPNAGGDGAITLCATDKPTDLFAQLTGADAGGTWIAPNGAAHSASLDPSVDAAGVYIYTIAPMAPCAGDAAQVMVAISTPPHAGTDAVLSACDQGGVVDLFAQLVGADEGGSWTGPDGLPHSIVFDPTVDGSGTYTYSLAGDPPCPSDAATVIVNVVAEPDAGSAGARTFCTSDAPTSLFEALGGTPDMGGTWTDPNGILHGADLDPATDATGPYTYTVAASQPCPSASSVVTITIQAMPDAGNDGMRSLCTNAGSTDLFSALGGTPQAGGSWTDPDGNAMSGMFDPASGVPGNHVYTVAGIAPCPSSSAVVQVAVVGSPDAGDDAALALCTNSDPFPLTDALAGTPDITGTWTAPDGLPAPVLLDPSTAPGGTYTYIVGGDAPCVNDTARLTVTVHLLPTNGLSAEVSACTSDAPIDLFAAFAGASQSGGAWTAPSGTPISTPLDPATAPGGVYTYTVTGTAPCPNGINTVTVHVDAPFTAGNDGSVVFCASDAPLSLFHALGGTPDANGTWTDPAGAPMDGVLDPATDAAGDHFYQVPANGACPGDQAVVSVVINVPPDTGLDNAMTWCENTDPLDPLSWLNGTPQAGGSWSDPYGMPFTGPLDPASAAEGPYTYTVPGLAPCPAASAVLTVAIDALPDPGDDAAIVLCPEAPAFDLAPLLGTPLTTGGAWTDPLGLPTTGFFDPAVMPSGDYTYTVAGTGACTGITLASLVEVAVHAAPSAAFTADTTIGCIPLTVIFSVQDPSVASVLWQFDDGGASTGTPTTSHTFNAAGSYSIQAVVTDTNGCTSTLLAEDLIFIQPPPIAWFSADPDPTNTNDPAVTFTPTQVGYPGYSWAIDGHTTGSGAPWAYAFPDAIGGTYVVCLTVTDAIGCTATYCDPVRVEDALAYHVPNAFTPDGDGINDGFAPIAVGADREHYGFFIFDRWGMIVFESHTVGEAWDGTMGNHGDALPEDVYVWRLLIGDRFSTDRKEEMGHVTLLR